MPAPKKLTVYSEGHGNDVKIMNEDGNVVEGVREATINIQAGEFNRIELEVSAAATSVTGHATGCSFTCPLCHEVNEHTCDS